MGQEGAGSKCNRNPDPHPRAKHTYNPAFGTEDLQGRLHKVRSTEFLDWLHPDVINVTRSISMSRVLVPIRERRSGQQHMNALRDLFISCSSSPAVSQDMLHTIQRPSKLPDCKDMRRRRHEHSEY